MLAPSGSRSTPAVVTASLTLKKALRGGDQLQARLRERRNPTRFIFKNEQGGILKDCEGECAFYRYADPKYPFWQEKMIHVVEEQHYFQHVFLREQKPRKGSRMAKW